MTMYVAPSMTSYTEAELMAQMEAWGVSGQQIISVG